MAKKKKQTLVITQTLVTDGKINLSNEELVELIRLKYPDFPIGDCTVDGNYLDDHYGNDSINEIVVQSTKSEKI